MAGQLTALGARELVSTIGGIVPPALVNGGISATNPVWKPGLIAIDYSVSPPQPYHWNTTAWVAGTASLYIALLTGDPTVSGPGGGYARAISDLIEDTTAGYSRQSVTFGLPDNYSSSTAYAVGEQMDYEGYIYTCATAVTGTAPVTAGDSDSNWTFVGPDYPAAVANTAALTYSYTADMAAPVNWAALVTAASGTAGFLKYLWAMPDPEQVAASQSIQIGIGKAAVTQG